MRAGRLRVVGVALAAMMLLSVGAVGPVAAVLTTPTADTCDLYLSANRALHISYSAGCLLNAEYAYAPSIEPIAGVSAKIVLTNVVTMKTITILPKDIYTATNAEVRASAGSWSGVMTVTTPTGSFVAPTRIQDPESGDWNPTTAPITVKPLVPTTRPYVLTDYAPDKPSATDAFAAGSPATVRFSQPVVGVSTATVKALDKKGRAIPLVVTYNASMWNATVRPKSGAFKVGDKVVFSKSIHNADGKALYPYTATFEAIFL